ncbi:LPXTG cell wall anchor domain-containing protein [Pediococcus pentosaceus]
MKHKKILVMSATALISTSFLATQVVSADNKVIDTVNISTAETTTIKQQLMAVIKKGKTYINYSKYDKSAIDTLVQYISFAESDIKNGASDTLMQTDIDSINSSILLVKNSETGSTDTTNTTDNTDTTSTTDNTDITSTTDNTDTTNTTDNTDTTSTTNNTDTTNTTDNTDTTNTTNNTDTTSTKVNADTTSATNKSTTLVKNKISDSKELKSSKSILPQTGEDDAWGLASLGLITLGVASWFTFRKKKSNID